MKKLFGIIAFIVFGLFLFAGYKLQSKANPLRVGSQITYESEPELISTPDEPITIVERTSDQTIQVAILLDTSNSMDGLIDQAKSRLWNIVNTLTTLKYEGESPEIEISLYEYGNDGIEPSDNYVRKVTSLTQDLDLISEKLFSLRTNGGSEYCGAVISEANEGLDWEANESSMKLIYIAGNEPFTQGEIHYKEAISSARKSNIYVNTIFCGDKEEGIDGQWKDGADLGEGKYFNIDSDKKVIYISTPYDDQIDEFNKRLNATYYGYGSLGREKKALQLTQDENASSISKENKVERSVAKTKKRAYKNESWDLLDRVEKDKSFLENAKDSELPVEIKGKTLEEKKAFVNQKSAERTEIQEKIAELSIKRDSYIKAELVERGDADKDDLGAAIEESILQIGKMNGFEK